MPGALCIDIGATKTATGIFSNGKITGALQFPTPNGIEKAILLCAKKSRGMDYPRVCIALAGSVENGIVLRMPNLSSPPHFNAKKFSEKLFHTQVFIENDVKCAALAEMKYGAAKNKTNTILAWPGSGIGGAILTDGKLLRGAHNCAGEFGHMKIEFGKGARKCGCGKRGCFETYCGGRGVEKAYFAATGKRKSAKEIFSSANNADIAFANDAAHLFGVGLAKIANKLKPELIIVGGSLSNAYLGRYKKIALASFKSNTKPPADSAKIMKSHLENAVLLGAALI